MKKCELKRAVVTEELYALTCDTLSSVILKQFLYWLPRRRDINTYIAEEIQREIQNVERKFTGGWIYKSAKELKSEIMFSHSEETIRRRIEDLIKNGWLIKRRNPKFNWDRTYQYRPDLHKIETDLNALGYTLATVMGKDFSLVSSVFNDNRHIPHGVETNPRELESKMHDAEAIPEITSENISQGKEKASRRSQPFPALSTGVFSNDDDSSSGSITAEHPLIAAIKEVTNYYPPRNIWEEMVNAGGETPDIPRMERAFKAWVNKGYNTQNYNGWFFDWYLHDLHYVPDSDKVILDYLPGSEKALQEGT